MKTNKIETVIIDDKEIEVSDLLLNMSVSNPITSDGKTTVNVNMRLRPFAIIDGIKIETPELSDRVVLIGDLLSSGDDDMLQCFIKINTAIQEYVLKKNI